LCGLFKKASNYNILVVLDACHSGGMARSPTQIVGRLRTCGFWQVQSIALPALPTLPKTSDTGEPLPHVTFHRYAYLFKHNNFR
jgi:hypothetical protein